MKKSRFSGWTDVYSFTFRQSVKKGGYRAVTAIMSILLVALVALIIVLTGKPESEEVEKSAIQQVYLVDESGLPVDYGMWFTQLGMTEYSETKFQNVDSMEAALEAYAGLEEVPCVIVKLTKGEGYLLEAVLPKNASISESEAESLLEAMVTCFETNKYVIAGLTEEQLLGVMTPTMADYVKIGEEQNIAIMLIKMLAPMVFGLVLYMMLILYGQEIGREVSAEKTSKLAEMLLTTVKPYALIAGKVLAVATAGILQFMIWVASIFVGLFAGNAIAASMYPEYQSVIGTILDFFHENLGASAFSPAAIILALVIFVVGFLVYCVMAGLAGSFVAKPEDIAQTQGIFQFPIIIAFFATYFGTLAGSEKVMDICRYVPFTSPFSVPVEVLTGTTSILEAVISLVILLVFSLLVIIVAGRLYEGLILYNGQKLSPKTIWGIITAKRIQSEVKAEK
ncbi:MAG: ABC transporter permease [Lachnospiraceae bacterium]|nr:ABC transporter permease [Lachnospiraceae bacterium]